MIKIKGNQKRNIEMDLVPLINIVFLLLIFFMLTSSSISGVLQAELPEALSASKVPGKNIVIKVSQTGLLEVNGSAIGLDELQSHVEQVLAQTKTKVVEIHGDKNIKFELFGGVIGKIRRAGVEDFIFATDKPQKH